MKAAKRPTVHGPALTAKNYPPRISAVLRLRNLHKANNGVQMMWKKVLSHVRQCGSYRSSKET